MSHLCPPSGVRAIIEHELVVRVVERPRAASDPGAGVAAVAPVARPNGVGAHERRRLQRGQENYNTKLEKFTFELRSRISV